MVDVIGGVRPLSRDDGVAQQYDRSAAPRLLAESKCLDDPLRGLRIGALAAILAVAVLTSSCGRKAARAAPPPVAPAVSSAPAPEPPSKPVSEPQTRATLPAAPPVPAAAVPEVPGPLADVAGEDQHGLEPQPQPPKPAPRIPAAVAETPPEPTGPLPPVPQLGQILTEEQRGEYNRLIDRSISRASEKLQVVLAHTDSLNSEQSAAVKRIRAFLRQAEEARKQDLAMARSLADRAELLADDLAKNFK